MRTEPRILSAAMYELARTIQSGDGVANAAIAEAAERLDAQTVEIARLKAMLADLVDYDLCYVGGEANTEDPRSLWNRVKRARAVLKSEGEND